MALDLKQQYPDSLRVIFISASETCSLDSFIDQYLEGRNARLHHQTRHDVRIALMNYPGAAPVRIFELNAWLDNSFRVGVFRRLEVKLLRLVLGNDPLHKWRAKKASRQTNI